MLLDIVLDRSERGVRAATKTPRVEPASLALLSSGELARRAAAAYAHLEDCDLCAR